MSCSFFENCVEGEGPVVEQIIDVDDFEGIKLERNITVYLTQADVQKVTIVSPQNIIDLLLTEVKSENWEINFSRCPKTEEKIKIYIESNNIHEIVIEGSVEVFSEGQIESDELTIDITGSGLIDLDLKVKELKTEISGAGDI